MKKMLSMLAMAGLAITSQSLPIEHTNTATIVISQACDGTYKDFQFNFCGYDNQKFKFTFDVDLTNTYCKFRIIRPIQGIVYVDVPYTDVTVANTSVTWAIAHSNIPSPGNYYGELLSYESTATNVTRSIAQGRIAITWSLFLNETNYYVPAP